MRLLSLNGKARRTRIGVPLTPREVGKFLRSTILRHRSFTERSRRAPRGGVVDVDVRYESLLQALHQAVVHDVVHAPVAPQFASPLSRCLPEWMLVLVAKRIDGVPILLLRTIGLLCAVEENTRRVVGEHSLCSLDRIEAAVGTRIDHIVLQKDRPAF